MFLQSPETRLKLKQHARHLYLGWAIWAMRKGDDKDMHNNLVAVDNFQKEIDEIEAASIHEL